MPESQKILIADDDADIREVVRVLLESEGFSVCEAADGDEAFSLIGDEIDLYILDIMMPGKSGIQLCRDIRAVSTAPILFLTAKSQDGDKTLGFSAGADDYLAKPFSYSELISRVKALLRRYLVYKGKDKPVQEENARMTYEDFTFDTKSSEVRKGGELLPLTDIEYRLFLLLAQNRRRIFSAQEIYETIWQDKYFYSCNNTVMVHIRNLRRKIEPDADNPRYLKTVWGKGYRVE